MNEAQVLQVGFKLWSTGKQLRLAAGAGLESGTSGLQGRTLAALSPWYSRTPEKVKDSDDWEKGAIKTDSKQVCDILILTSEKKTENFMISLFQNVSI